MNQEQASASSPGFTGSEGRFRALPARSNVNFEYASKSVAELQVLIDDYIIMEEYEKCAEIRDEIMRRR